MYGPNIRVRIAGAFGPGTLEPDFSPFTLALRPTSAEPNVPGNPAQGLDTILSNLKYSRALHSASSSLRGPGGPGGGSGKAPDSVQARSLGGRRLERKVRDSP